MNKLIISLLIILFTSSLTYAQDTDAILLEASVDDSQETIDAEDTVETEFSIFEHFDSEKSEDEKTEPETFMQKILKKDITRTDVPTFLLKDELTHHYEKGAIAKIQYFGAYQGNLSSSWNSGDYDTSYDIGFMEVGAIGRFSHTKTDFKVSVNPRSKKGVNYMQGFFSDVYIVNKNIPHHRVVVGYSRNQIGKEGGSTSYILPFATRSQIARNFGSTRALGVRLIGDYSLMDYSMAFNSSDRYFHTPFAGPEFTGWINVKPFGKTDGKYGKLVVGGGLNAGHNKTNYTVGSIYVGYNYKKIWTNFEYAIADGYNGRKVSTNKAEGFNYTLGYKINPHLQLIARYDQFDPNRSIANNQRREYTAGINWFIKGQSLRVILNYVFCDNQNKNDSHRIILGTQFVI